MNTIVVKVECIDGYPGGNEPTATVWVYNTQTGLRERSDGGGYGNAGYKSAVDKARGLARLLNAGLEIAPMGRFLSEVERDARQATPPAIPGDDGRPGQDAQQDTISG